MEVSRASFTFTKGVLKGVMYRTPDGKIQRFFVSIDYGIVSGLIVARCFHFWRITGSTM